MKHCKVFFLIEGLEGETTFLITYAILPLTILFTFNVIVNKRHESFKSIFKETIFRMGIWLFIYELMHFVLSLWLSYRSIGFMYVNMYSLIKESLCTWWLQYRKLEVMFKVHYLTQSDCLAADRQDQGGH
jgi:hypothetical protein